MHDSAGTLMVTLPIAGPAAVRMQQAKPIVNNFFTFHHLSPKNISSCHKLKAMGRAFWPCPEH
jgi:hypothetical protein